MYKAPSSPLCSDFQTPAGGEQIATSGEKVAVLDATGQRLSPCSVGKARRMLAEGKAKIVTENPLTIRLAYAVALKGDEKPVFSKKTGFWTASNTPPGEGKRLLLHICCGPCSTYTIKRLREQGFEVSGFWYNPNIHPFTEHERRRECVRLYTEQVNLTMIWEQGYEMPAYLRAVVGHETLGERCAICYRLRLERTAQKAQQNSFDAFTTTLLISPYQQQALIRNIGEELAHKYGVEFYFENLRKGWSERGHMTREHDLYQQHYCGCIYSEWEAMRGGSAPRDTRVKKRI